MNAAALVLLVALAPAKEIEMKIIEATVQVSAHDNMDYDDGGYRSSVTFNHGGALFRSGLPLGVVQPSGVYTLSFLNNGAYRKAEPPEFVAWIYEVRQDGRLLYRYKQQRDIASTISVDKQGAQISFTLDEKKVRLPLNPPIDPAVLTPDQTYWIGVSEQYESRMIMRRVVSIKQTIPGKTIKREMIDRRMGPVNVQEPALRTIWPRL